MKYLSQINGFWNWRKLNELSSKQADLYFAILDCANSAGWKRSFNVPNSTLQSMCQMSKTELYKNRNVLIQLGLIRYENGKKSSAGIYSISPLYDTHLDTNPDTNLGTNVDTNSGTNVDTNPGNILRVREDTDKINYQQIADMYNDTCVSFPRCTQLSAKRKEALRARFRSGYTESDFKELFEKAQASSFLKGGNNRNWRASFDWLIADSNMAKVLDGNYDDRPSTSRRREDISNAGTRGDAEGTQPAGKYGVYL